MIKNIAEELAISHFTFYRKIGNRDFSGYEKEKAYQILSDTKSIHPNKLAYMAGFSNPKYFNKCFIVG